VTVANVPISISAQPPHRFLSFTNFPPLKSHIIMAPLESSARPTAAARLRAHLGDESKILVCPGVFDGLTARIALSEGFDCLYMVCYFSSSHWLLGLC
jgi:hypothetical protein